MKYYLDTNTIIYFLKGTFPELSEHFKKTPRQSIVIPSVVKAELEFGIHKSVRPAESADRIHRFINAFETAPFSDEAAVEYGKIRFALEKAGTPMGPNDLLIASIVKAEDGVLVTHNRKEFERVEGLLLEDWTI